MLPREPRDVLEVVVLVEHRVPGGLGDGRHEQVGDARSTMVTCNREETLDLDGAVLGAWRGEDRDEPPQHAGLLRLEIGQGPRGVADLQPGDRGDVHETAVDALQPQAGLGAVRQSGVGGLVDEPGHDQAAFMTSGSSRSRIREAEAARSSTVRAVACRCRACSERTRTRSAFLEMPSRRACRV